MTYHCHPKHSHKQRRLLHRAWGHREQKNNKQETGQAVLTTTKPLTKTTNCSLLGAKKAEGHDQKKIFRRKRRKDNPTFKFVLAPLATNPVRVCVTAKTILPFRPTDRGFSKLALVKSKYRKSVAYRSSKSGLHIGRHCRKCVEYRCI